MLPAFATWFKQSNYNGFIALLVTHKLYEYFMVIEKGNGSMFHLTY